MGDHRIPLQANTVACILGAIALVMITGSITGQLILYLTSHNYAFGLIQLFYVDTEYNFPTAFSVLLLLLSALLLLIITLLKKNSPDFSTFYWAVLTSGFSFMAIDEAWQIHEKMIIPMRNLLGNESLGIFYYAWVIPAIALVLVIGLLFMKFLSRLSRNTRTYFLMAAGFYLGGAICFELLGGYYAELNGFRNLTYSMIVTIEESLEMGGIILFIWALLNYLRDNFDEITLSFQNR